MEFEVRGSRLDDEDQSGLVSEVQGQKRGKWWSKGEVGLMLARVEL